MFYKYYNAITTSIGLEQGNILVLSEQSAWWTTMLGDDAVTEELPTGAYSVIDTVDDIVYAYYVVIVPKIPDCFQTEDLSDEIPISRIPQESAKGNMLFGFDIETENGPARFEPERVINGNFIGSIIGSDFKQVGILKV